MTQEELAVSALVNADPFRLCGAMHHAKRDRHRACEPCPVVLRVKESWEIIRARLAFAKAKTEQGK